MGLLVGEKVYLGDGAYAQFDSWGIWLTTEDGYRTTNQVYLEPNVLEAFERFVRKLRAEIKEPESQRIPRGGDDGGEAEAGSLHEMSGEREDDSQGS